MPIYFYTLNFQIINSYCLNLVTVFSHHISQFIQSLIILGIGKQINRKKV